MVIFMIVALYLLLLAFDFYPIVKTAKKQELYLYVILTCVSFGILLANSLDVHIPEPSKIIRRMVESLIVVRQ